MKKKYSHESRRGPKTSMKKVRVEENQKQIAVMLVSDHWLAAVRHQAGTKRGRWGVTMRPEEKQTYG
jgi:hypothetical protein